MSRWGGWLVALLILGVGLYIGGMTLGNLVEGQGMQDGAETVEATVVESGTRDANVRAEGEFYLIIEVRYRYTVDGRTYESENVFAATGPETLGGRARSLADRYREGDTVTAYYPPGNPEGAFLVEPTLADVTYNLTGAVLLVFIGIVNVLYLLLSSLNPFS